MKYWIEKRTGIRSYYVLVRENEYYLEGYGHGTWWLLNGSYSNYIRRYWTYRGALRRLKKMCPTTVVIKESVIEV